MAKQTKKGTKWKRRHNITEISIAGEEGEVSAKKVESWQERVKEITRCYAPQHVWDEDETGSFWKALPDKSLSERGTRCRGGKNSMQRAFFVNAAGGKESPVFIGESKKPRCVSKLKEPTILVVLTISATIRHGCTLKLLHPY